MNKNRPYAVEFYRGGYRQVAKITEAKGPVQAAKQANGYYVWEHCKVTDQKSKKVARYIHGKYGKHIPVKGEVRLFKTYAGSFPSIIVMVGNVIEFVRYESVSTRDKAYEEATCIISPSAGSASPDPEPTVTTALSDETNVSSGGLTSRKIWSGSVESATIQDVLTRESIDNNFGDDSAAATVKVTWNTGYTASPSRREPTTLLVTVKTLPEPAPFPGVVESMKLFIGKTLKATKDKKNKKVWHANGYLWHEDWLDFDRVYAKVIAPTGQKKGGLYWDENMRRYVGQTLEFTPCYGSTPTHYKHGGWCFDIDWLSPSEKTQGEKVWVKVKPVKKWSQVHATVFVSHMERYIGQTLLMDYDKVHKMYKYDGWTFSPKWVEVVNYAQLPTEGS